MKLQHLEAVKKIEDSNKYFSIKLYDHVAHNNNNNVVVSPFSIQSVLSMVLSGAAGETANQIRFGLSLPEDKFLHSGLSDILTSMGDKSENYTLKAVNRLYIQNGFHLRPRFLAFNQRTYQAVPETVDFQEVEKARQAINTWVREETNQKIEELISPGVLTPLSRLVLINALYFKGTWVEAFDKADTRKKNFHTNNGQVVSVDMMHKIGGFNYRELHQLDAKRLMIPYKGDRLSMTIILPNKKDGLQKLEERLRSVDLSEIFNQKTAMQRVSFSLPKFKIDSTHDLKDPLTKIGIQHMFDQKNADFSGMSEAKELFVSHMIQKAFIEVNEEGSEASAATGAAMRVRAGIPTKPLQFTCDHPFLFMIKDHLTGVILFSGKITNPII